MGQKRQTLNPVVEPSNIYNLGVISGEEVSKMFNILRTLMQICTLVPPLLMCICVGLEGTTREISHVGSKP